MRSTSKPLAPATTRIGLLTAAPVASVVIAGTGGFVLEVGDYLRAQEARGGPVVAGCLEPGPVDPPDGAAGLPCLGHVDDYVPAEGQVVVVAIGDVAYRRRAFERLWARGIATPAFVADHAVVSPAAWMGEGAVVCPFSIVNSGAHVGPGVLVNVHATIAHGAFVGDMSVLCPYVAINGDARVGADCFLGTRATVFPRVAIGAGCVVDTHGAVRADAPERHLVSSRGTYVVTRLRSR